MSKPELLAPGGSFDQAWQALQAGADAVYIGAERFSARAHAKNLNIKEVASLCGAARTRGAKVYVAINTVLQDDECRDALRLSAELYLAGVQAIIIQDIGFAACLKKAIPELKRHASTQCAIHNKEGAREAFSAGFVRAVLSRELSTAEIAAIHQAVPELELEVFVHGALCYSVSGLCMASGQLTGRSANRGDCAQICRTWFEGDEPLSGKFAASMTDLHLGPRIHELTTAGVSAFKIEGRMKPSVWSRELVLGYRALLDQDDKAEAERHFVRAKAIFSRTARSGYLDGTKKERLIDPLFAGSRGEVVGTIESVQGKRVTARLSVPVFINDGLQVLGNSSDGKRLEARRFGVRAVQEGNGVTQLDVSEQLQTGDVGSVLYRIALHDGSLGEVQPSASGAWRHPVALTLAFENETIVLKSTAFGGVQLVQKVETSEARGNKGLAEVLEERLGKQGDHFSVPGISWSGSKPQGLYVQPDVVKALRRSWHELLLQKAQLWIDSRAQALEKAFPAAKSVPEMSRKMRQSLSPRLQPHAALGFVVEPTFVEPENLAPVPPDFPGMEALLQSLNSISSPAKWLSLPLAPFTPDSCTYVEGIETLLAKMVAGTGVLLGLGNLGHLAWLERLRTFSNQRGITLACFLDYGFNLANSYSVQTLTNQVSASGFRSADFLGWTENSTKPAFRSGEFNPPLFIGRACMLRNSNNKALCPPDCTGNFERELRQGKQKFCLLGLHCMNYLLSKP